MKKICQLPHSYRRRWSDEEIEEYSPLSTEMMNSSEIDISLLFSDVTNRVICLDIGRS